MDPLNQLVDELSQHWTSFVVGEYSAPPCPPSAPLASLLRSANYAAAMPEEGRYPKFNVAAYRAGDDVQRLWRFEEPRDYNVAELRRLIPATDARKSAVCVEWDTQDVLRIVGIQDLGSTWQRAKEGLAYQYDAPEGFFVEIERPNRFAVYQRQFRVATFSDGAFEVLKELSLHTFLHEAVRGGLGALDSGITPPDDEPLRESSQFEFLALWNCFASIVNLIVARGHGGALIILPNPSDVSTPLLRPKYSLHGRQMSEAFLGFINARHRVGNEYWRREAGEEVADERLARLEWGQKHAYDNLVESTRIVAQFAQCDGALVMTRSLEVLGFGTEIAAELRQGCAVKNVVHEIRREYRTLDVEQFGMRHRSAIKLASHLKNAVTLIVSQDGPVSAVWGDGSSVFVYKGVRLVNANAPWA